MSEANRVSAWMTAQPHTIGDDQSLFVARERMHHWNVRHLPVLRGGHLVGVLSERDIALVEALVADVTNRPNTLAEVRVEEAMTADPYVVKVDARLADVASAMAQQRIGAAIVTEGADQVIGVFTTTDALRALARLAG